VSDGLYVNHSAGKGRGVFTRSDLPADTIIETAPVIVMSHKDRIFLDQTLLHDYIFEWNKKEESCCMALGYVPLYNHSYHSNCEYEMDHKKEIITIKTVRAVKKGEELFINYNGNWNDAKPLWFDAK
jgi:SET domain-containing protein